MPGNLCEHCVGYCCRHIALPIETPDDREDFDDIRWYLLHEGVTVFVEDEEWFIHIEARCRHLQPDFRCGVYHTRPRICREYSTENCDYHSGDYGWELHFTCAEHLDAYVEETLTSKKKRVTSKGKKSSTKTKAGRSTETKKSKKIKTRLKIKLGRRPPNPDQRYNRAALDIHGVALPVLGDQR